MLNARNRLHLDESGTFLVIFALLLAIIAGFAGFAIDYSNAVNQRQKFQSIADGVVLDAASSQGSLSHRISVAQVALNAALANEPQARSIQATVTGDPTSGKVQASIAVHVKGYLTPIVGIDGFDIAVKAGASSQSSGRTLDVAMCIDATGSMQFIIDGVVNNALGFYDNLNASFAAKGLPTFDLIRVRPIIFRDFGGNYRYNAANGWVVDKFPNGWQARPPFIYTNYGDDEPLRAPAGFFNLPADSNPFDGFVQPEVANGGGDYTESGLECLNEAMNSPWLRVGDPITTPAGAATASSVISVIGIWTDENAHPPSWPLSLANPNYPPANVMPRDFAGLTAKWNDPNVIPQEHKLLVHFYPNGVPPSGVAPTDPSSGWYPIRSWNGYMRGGTLTDGVSNMIDRIADAVATLPSNNSARLTN